MDGSELAKYEGKKKHTLLRKPIFLLTKLVFLTEELYFQLRIIF